MGKCIEIITHLQVKALDPKRVLDCLDKSEVKDEVSNVIMKHLFKEFSAVGTASIATNVFPRMSSHIVWDGMSIDELIGEEEDWSDDNAQS
jgi:hypothetical protein